MANDPVLFTSIRYDPLMPDGPWYMLEHHRDRLQTAARHFWPTSQDIDLLDLKHLIDAGIQSSSDGESAPSSLRVKILLNKDGNISIDSFSPTPAVPLENLYPSHLPVPGSDIHILGDATKGTAWPVLPDLNKTIPDSYTRYKTTQRDVYDRARKAVGIETMTEKKEVLLISENKGEIMEGSLTSVYFWRGGQWATPFVKDGGQEGTTRRWALEKGLCVEGTVLLDELVDGEECWFSNGVRGFTWGKIQLSE